VDVILKLGKNFYFLNLALVGDPFSMDKGYSKMTND